MEWKAKEMRSWIPALLLASAAVVATPALAQDQGHWQHGGNDQRGGGDHGGRGDGDRRGGGQGYGRGHDGQRAPQAGAPAERSPGPSMPRGDVRANGDRPYDNGSRSGWQGGAPGRHVEGRPDNGVQVWRDQPHGGERGDGRFDRGGPDHRDGGDWNRGRPSGEWSRGWRQDNRYDWRGWRDSHRDAYHVGRYRAPYGYAGGYRRWGVGVRIGPAFYARQYWIDDPWAYRLPPAEGPYRWVRYYNDALLINIYSGYVVDEIPGFFW